MNKLFKVLTAAVVAIMLIACVGVLAACNDNGNNNDNNNGNNGTVEENYVYKFTVKDANGNPIEGIQVQLCKGSDFCLTPVSTDANGVATFDSEFITPDVYDIHVLNDGYAFDNDAHKTSATQKDYELILSSK